MKKLKALTSSLAVSLALMAAPLSAASSIVNVPVVDGAWTFIGVPGFQSYGGTSGSTTTTWPTLPSNTQPLIIDASGSVATTYQVAGLEVPTWDGNVTSPVTPAAATAGAFESTDGVTPRAANSGAGVGSNIYGTVAVMALGHDTTGVQSTTLDHNGAIIVALAGWTPKAKDYESPIRTMYVKSPNAAAPDIKVQYMARYEGESFLIEYETSGTALTRTDNVTYSGTFNHTYTYENAAVLGTDFAVYTGSSTSGTSGNDVSGIIASFDMNLSDNNMSTDKNNIQPNTSLSTFNGTAYPYSLRGTLDGNMTVLGWDAATQQWRQFRATGDGSTVTTLTANDFSSFTQGQGYWVRVKRNGASVFANPAGFILGADSSVDINHSSVITDGWNMLNFGDRYFAYSVTGMLLAAPAAAGDDINITDTFGGTTLNITGISSALTNGENCAIINQALDGNSSFSYSNFHLRCIPTSTGLALLSTRRFIVQPYVAPTELNTAPLTAESNGSSANFYRAQYGNHALIMEPNQQFATVANTDGNMSIQFLEDSTVTGYGAVSIAGIATTQTSVLAAMTTASAGITTKTNGVTQLDMNYDGTYDALLLASNHRFFIKDATLVRTFTYSADRADTNGVSDNNTSMRVVGKAVTVATAGDTQIVDDNLSYTAININSKASSTEVNATKMEGNEDNTTIIIWYTGWNASDATRVAKIDLQEWGNSWDVLTETYCTDYTTKFTGECNASTKGGIGKVWNISSIAEYIEDQNGSNEYDGNYSFTSLAISDNIKNNAIFAENFPTSGPLYNMVSEYGVQPELIITGQTEAGGLPTSTTLGTYISWKQIDATIPPEQWYDNDDQYELFWTEKEKGYWVYINGTATNDLSFGTIALSGNGNPYSHFNNYFAAGSTIGLTRNHLNDTLSVAINNLVSSTAANTNTDAYEVYATIGGVTTSLQRDTANNAFIMPLDSHETNGLMFDDGEVAVTITAAYGSGKKVTTNYTLDYEKPVISSVSINMATATVAITNGTAAASDIYVYNGDINDSLYSVTSTGTNSVGTPATNWAGSATVAGATTDVNLGGMTGLTFPTAFESNSSAYLDSTQYDILTEQIAEGLIRDVRIVAKDSQTLFSDQRRLLYVPVYSGTGILSDDGTDTIYDSNPLVYTTAGVQNTAYSGAVGGLDDGVQLKSAVSGTTVSCVYAHKDVALNESVANVKTLQTSAGTDFAVIMYMDDYIGQPFMCEVNGQLYVGGFVNADTYTADITVQALSSSVTGITVLKQ